jgi:uncharacterized protein
MRLGFVIFFVVLLALLAAVNLFVHRRVSRGLALERRGRRILAGTLIFGMAAMIFSRLLGRYLTGLAPALGAAGAVVQLGAIVGFAILAIERLLHGTGRLASLLHRHTRDAGELTGEAPAPAGDVPVAAPRRLLARDGEASEPVAETNAFLPAEVVSRSPELPRRTFLEAAAATSAVALGGGSAFYGAVYGRHDYSIEEVPVSLEKLPRELDGFTIAQLSDVHFGAFVGDKELAAGVELVRSIRPDLVVLTGDLVDSDPLFAAVLGRFARRLGEVAPVFAIPGNHDYYAGIEETLGQLRDAGAGVLVNRHQRVGEGRIVLAGVDDVWGARVRRGPDLERALAGAPPELPRVLLCHNPVFFPEAADQVDLQLSGHTHGGQFNPGVRVADLVLPFGYVAGRYERGASQLYVNRGFGTAGPPARLGAAPEITKIVLTT